MRVLHIASSIDPQRGGPAVALAGLAEALVAAGVQVSVAATWIRGESTAPAEQLRRQGVQVRLLGPSWQPLRRNPQIIGTLREMIPAAQVVHIHALWEEIQHQAARLCRSFAVPYIFRPCGMLDPWSLRQSRFKKWLYMQWRLRGDLNGAAALHYTSDLERDLASPLRLRPPPLVVPNGVNLGEFQTVPERGFLRRRFPQIGDRQIALFLSRIHPKKGLDLLLRAFARIERQRRMMVITGPDADAYEGELRDLARSLGLETSVLFTGPMYGRDRVAALRDADLFVLPSRQENFGIAVVEALAAGVPVVISDQVNIYREIRQAQVGGVVRLDVEELAGELNRWLEDAHLRGQAAARARPFVFEHYDWTKIAQHWAGEYERLAASAAARPVSVTVRRADWGLNERSTKQA